LTEALPPPEARVSPEITAASAFSLTIRRYSAGEHLFCAISNVRRRIVSHDANIKPVIMAGVDTLLRRWRDAMIRTFPGLWTLRLRSFGLADRGAFAGTVISVVMKSPGIVITCTRLKSRQSPRATRVRKKAGAISEMPKGSPFLRFDQRGSV
jgi:hypothetical protein